MPLSAKSVCRGSCAEKSTNTRDGEQEKEDFGVGGSSDDDARSICTTVLHELERVEKQEQIMRQEQQQQQDKQQEQEPYDEDEEEITSNPTPLPLDHRNWSLPVQLTCADCVK